MQKCCKGSSRSTIINDSIVLVNVIGLCGQGQSAKPEQL